jgi:hypothetical protein
VPRPLTVTNGAAKWPAGFTGDMMFEGSVDAQGNLRMRSNLGTVAVGKIDASGAAKAGGGITNCTIFARWQKQK